MIKALPITSFVKLDLPSINKLANEFLSTQNLSGTEGKCAAMAKAFSEFLKQKKVPSQIIDARNYKGLLKNVGNSNHVLAAVNGYYIDFTAKQFDPKVNNIIIDRVDNLHRDWDIVNIYKDYNDFYVNFSKDQK